MGIRAAITRLTVLEAALSITDPVTMTIKKAWPYIPRGNVGVPELPAWFNNWTFTREERLIGLRILHYTINVRLLVGDADSEQDRRADIATAFHEKLIDSLDGDVTLASNVTSHNRRGGDPTLVVIEHGGKGYIGLNEFLDVEIKSAKAFA